MQVDEGASATSDAEAEAWDVADRNGRRADFMAALVRELGTEVAARALDECADAIERELRASEPRGAYPEAGTAWSELARALDDADNPLYRTAIGDLEAMAIDRLEALDLTRRTVLWLSRNWREADEQSDMWSPDRPAVFDPATAWPGCMDGLVDELLSDVQARMRARPRARA